MIENLMKSKLNMRLTTCIMTYYYVWKKKKNELINFIMLI